MNIKPKGIHATFQSECWKCGDEITVSNGRVDNHDCRPPQPKTLAEIRAALDRRSE